MMLHPERMFLGVQHSWTRDQGQPQRLFENARKWAG